MNDIQWQLEGEAVEVDLDQAKKIAAERLFQARDMRVDQLQATYRGKSLSGDDDGAQAAIVECVVLKGDPDLAPVRSAASVEELSSLTLEDIWKG